MRRRRIGTVMCAGLSLVAGLLCGFAAADSDGVNAADSVAAIQQAAPEALDGLATMEDAPDGESARSTTRGAAVSVPLDPSAGVELDAAGVAHDLRIQLPFAAEAGDATASPEQGVLVYDNHNGSSTVPVVYGDGSMAINTVIDDASAPHRYDYAMTIAGDQSLRLNEDGSAVVAGDGAVSVVIPIPWAKDARGEAVPTHYEVDGDTLTQVVDFTAATAFPVVADPRYWWGCSWC